MVPHPPCDLEIGRIPPVDHSSFGPETGLVRASETVCAGQFTVDIWIA